MKANKLLKLKKKNKKLKDYIRDLKQENKELWNNLKSLQDRVDKFQKTNEIKED